MKRHPVPEEREHVVANLAVMRMLAEVGAGEGDELELLAAIDGIDAVAGEKTLPRFHLDEDEKSAAPDDEIDLARAQAHVARDDAESAQAIEPRGATFAACAELP